MTWLRCCSSHKCMWWPWLTLFMDHHFGREGEKRIFISLPSHQRALYPHAPLHRRPCLPFFFFPLFVPPRVLSFPPPGFVFPSRGEHDSLRVCSGSSSSSPSLTVIHTWAVASQPSPAAAAAAGPIFSFLSVHGIAFHPLFFFSFFPFTSPLLSDMSNQYSSMTHARRCAESLSSVSQPPARSWRSLALSSDR